MRRAARETEGQPLMLLPLHEVPTGRNYQSMRVNKPFSYQEIQRIKEDLGDYLEGPEKYIRAFKGVTLHYDCYAQCPNPRAGREKDSRQCNLQKKGSLIADLSQGSRHASNAVVGGQRVLSPSCYPIYKVCISSW